ncbi:hypothetical protein C8R45DRAFT_1019179 [Mycena sanguinolenta]|nr:hypothetical protein C8R45DRAFT_1019179 [Mycena sanguinolenta]
MIFNKFIPRADQCTALENVTGNSPCNLNSGTICSGSQECTCSGISYFLAAACQVCANDETLSWEQYATTSHCSGLPEPVPSPFPTQPDPNHVIPSWVVVMAAATPSPSTFDAAVASAIVTSLAGSSPITSSTTTTPLPQSSTTPPPQALTAISNTRLSTTSTLSSFSSSSPVAANPNSATNSASAQIASPSAQTSATGAISEDSQAASHKSSAATIIVVIFIALFVMIFVATVLLCLRRRRRRSQIQDLDAHTRSTGRTILNIVASVPSDPSAVVSEKALEAGSPSTLRRSDSGRDGRTDIERSASPPPPGKIVGILSSRRAVNVGPQSPDSDVISGLTARIRDLEAQVQSMGLPDEAPPVYGKEAGS